MANVHVVSCGTSVLSNFATRYRDRLPMLPADVKSVDQLVPVLNTNPALATEAERIAHADPYEFFAELKAMRPFLENGQVDVAYLVSTSTPAATLSIRLLRRYLEGRGIQIDTGATFVGYRPGPDETEDDRVTAFAADLQVLRAKTLAYVRRRRNAGDRVFIAAQGGFKPEAGIMMLVGAECDAPIYYVHEQMGRTVMLPTLSYGGPVEPLRAVAQNGRQIGGPVATSLWKQYRPHFQAAEDAYAIEVRRDRATGEVVMIKLTDYGKFLAEESQ